MMIKIKPLTVNQAWQGRRYKSEQYKRYREELLLLLPDLDVPDGELQLTIEFGFSSRGSDIDNPIKPFLDALQERYEFNDNRVYRLVVTKAIVKRGDEYILFSIEEMT